MDVQFVVQCWSYDDHSEEGKAHKDTLHLDEQHGLRQVLQDASVKAWDYSSDVCSWWKGRGQDRFQPCGYISDKEANNSLKDKQFKQKLRCLCGPDLVIREGCDVWNWMVLVLFLNTREEWWPVLVSLSITFKNIFE